MTTLPTGTVTFLFTDIEGSTKLWEQYPEAMRSALAHHDAILREAIETHQGHIIKLTGDGVHAVFAQTYDAVDATVTAQHRLSALTLAVAPTALPIKVRMGLHTGEAELREGDYYGPTLNRAARLMSAGHGGQILISATTATVVRDHLNAERYLVDLGEHHLKGLLRAERIYQLNAPGLAVQFPPLQASPSRLTNLPPQLTSFVGREKESAEVKAMLEAARLVTLTGSGGTGKTRLSQEVGAQRLTDFQHGVWLVELAPLSDEAQIIPALAQVFGLQELPFNPLAKLVEDYLRDKKLLLIL
ncbi:MAG: adenylate/guanylate cyclase domain-containing protein, partial [Anaerolineales bacterium]|nr:adenylate/guanylate cyclase domain-containing protein [Anaerolineales bacterium]